MSKETLALRALALRLLNDRLKQADTTNRAAIAAEYRVKDRAAVWLPLNGQDVEVGHVRRDAGTVVAEVTSMTELIDWCEANAPTEVEEYAPAPVTRVRPAFLTALLANAKSNGAAVAEDGEVIPGIDVRTGDPRTVVMPAKSGDGVAALMEAIRSDPAALGSLLGELPAGESE